LQRISNSPSDEKGGDEGLIAFHGEIVYGQKNCYEKMVGEIKTI
jgi:hypothetical protein